MPEKEWWRRLEKKAAERAFLDAQAAQVSLEIVKKATFPLFIQRKGHWAPELLATGVLLAIRERVFVLTAAHVVEGLGRNALSIAVDDKITQIPGESYRTTLPKSGTHADDPVDAAVFAIPAEAGTSLLSHCASLRDLCPVDSAYNVAYWVYGFPLRWSKHVGGVIQTNPRCMTIGGLSIDIYERLKRRPDVHILMEMGKRVSTVKGMEAQRATRGMSGSGAWVLPAHHDENLPAKLAGIFIEKARGWPAFVAVSIRIHLRLILRYEPDLQKEIDEWVTSDSVRAFQKWLLRSGAAPSIPEERLEEWFAKKIGL